jgi:hypothetical protein
VFTVVLQCCQIGPMIWTLQGPLETQISTLRRGNFRQSVYPAWLSSYDMRLPCRDKAAVPATRRSKVLWTTQLLWLISFATS